MFQVPSAMSDLPWNSLFAWDDDSKNDDYDNNNNNDNDNNDNEEEGDVNSQCVIS